MLCKFGRVEGRTSIADSRGWNQGPRTRFGEVLLSFAWNWYGSKGPKLSAFCWGFCAKIFWKLPWQTGHVGVRHKPVFSFHSILRVLCGFVLCVRCALTQGGTSGTKFGRQGLRLARLLFSVRGKRQNFVLSVLCEAWTGCVRHVQWSALVLEASELRFSVQECSDARVRGNRTLCGVIEH